MGDLSRRADNQIRQVFKKKPKTGDPKKDDLAKRANKLMEARQRAVKQYKGY